nr:hypothetical protein [Candidatus Nanopelagicales bacterium]
IAPQTGAYCLARAKLPAWILQEIWEFIAGQLTRQTTTALLISYFVDTYLTKGERPYPLPLPVLWHPTSRGLDTTVGGSGMTAKRE